MYVSLFLCGHLIKLFYVNTSLFFFLYAIISNMAGTKRKAETEIPIMDENDLLKITPLGAGNEVGRSSILMEYKGKTILVSQKNDFGFGSYLNVVYFIIKIKSVLFAFRTCFLIAFSFCCICSSMLVFTLLITDWLLFPFLMKWILLVLMSCWSLSMYAFHIVDSVTYLLQLSRRSCSLSTLFDGKGE